MYAAGIIAQALGGRPAECTITAHHRTSVYKYPGSDLIAEEPVRSQIIFSRSGFKAALVSDLPSYFERHQVESLHYTIDVSLRHGVRNAYEKAVERSSRKTPAEVPLFIVLEHHEEVPATVLDRGECFAIDEHRDGKALIEGGRQGESALVAIRTIDGSWPEFSAGMPIENMVLAAINAEQDFTGPNERLCSCSCFASKNEQAVRLLEPGMSGALGFAIPRIDPEALSEKAKKIRSALARMIADSEPIVTELFDSIMLANTTDDSYLRLWYLRLWQALVDGGRHLGYPQFENTSQVIAGETSPKDLTSYRNQVAHWHTGMIDHSRLEALQLTALELLRRKYGL